MKENFQDLVNDIFERNPDQKFTFGEICTTLSETSAREIIHAFSKGRKEGKLERYIDSDGLVKYGLKKKHVPEVKDTEVTAEWIYPHVRGYFGSFSRYRVDRRLLQEYVNIQVGKSFFGHPDTHPLVESIIAEAKRQGIIAVHEHTGRLVTVTGATWPNEPFSLGNSPHPSPTGRIIHIEGNLQTGEITSHIST